MTEMNVEMNVEMKTEIESVPVCEICRDEIQQGVNYCSEEHEQFCKSCIGSLIECGVNSAFLGTCPVIYCPSTTHQKKNKKRKILIYQRWKSEIPSEVSTKYASLANSVLAFLCGGCHTLKSLDLGYESDRAKEVYTKIEKILQDNYNSPEPFAELEQRLAAYCGGDYTVEEIHAYIQQLFPSMVTMTDDEAWDIFSKILKMIPDPERRGNLHLRYLRDRPRIKTLCCSREHCFKCRIKDFHDGKTCAESTATLDQSIVSCPSCAISITRGDGCNTITCVCGKQFSWSVEKENSERCQAFLEAHPQETSIHCALVLCTRTPSPLVNQAKAWQIRNRIAVSRALSDWFKQKYPYCPSQCCVVLPLDQIPDGVKEAIELWKNAHSAEVTKCKNENEVALNSIFLNMYHAESERPIAAQRLVNHSKRGLMPDVDPKLIQSAAKWIEKNKEFYSRGLADYEERSARQFLFLFGTKSVRSTCPSYVNSPVGVEWDRTSSNPDLTYTNDNMSVERVGSVSCYPAAFCKLPAEKSTFRVVVDAAPKSSNWLTFGVARRGMANSSSDGVGRTSNTWGLSDDRSSSSNHTIVASCGTEVATFRKLRVGDILTAQIDVIDGWCEVSVNEDEFSHRFSIPSGSADDYVFAMSFANDHRVTIQPEAVGTKKTAPSKAGELNSDHTVMYNHLKKQLKSILVDTDDSKTECPPPSKLMTDGSRWVELCGSSQAAQQEFEKIKPAVDKMFSFKADKSVDGTDPLEEMSWNVLIEAISWYRQNRDRLKEEKKTELGLNFSVIYGDDAAFMAAMNLAEYHTHKVEKEETTASLAYMHMFPDEMNAWYDYNATLKEPVVENIAKGCRCLPRHTRTCPVIKK